jgi:hypothetical protein
MTALTLNDPAIFSLHQLTKHVYWETGFRCRLSNKVNLLKLLKFASYCKQGIIQRWYQSFLKQLSMQQLKLLIGYGIRLPKTLIKALTTQKAKPSVFSRLAHYIKQHFIG